MKVSIITPSFNQDEFIERTIQSVISQRSDEYDLEYVVMDGNSSDKTVEILKHYSDQLVWKSEPDNGQSHAVNKGIKMTAGEVIGWLNSDDVYCADAIKIVCQFFKEHPEVDVVYGDAYLIDRDDKILGFYATEPWKIERLKVRCFISQPAAFFRRRVVQRYGLLDESLQFCMDYGYWLRLGLKGAEFAYLPEVLASARIYQETKSSRCCVETSFESINMVKKELGYVPSAWLVNYSGAQVKMASGLNYPNPGFIFDVWMNLWKTAGLYHQGLPRVTAWFTAQQAMLKEFLRRSFYSFRKKTRFYSTYQKR